MPRETAAFSSGLSYGFGARVPCRASGARNADRQLVLALHNPHRPCQVAVIGNDRRVFKEGRTLDYQRCREVDVRPLLVPPDLLTQLFLGVGMCGFGGYSGTTRCCSLGRNRKSPFSISTFGRVASARRYSRCR